MNSQRVRTVILHTWYHFIHSLETWVDLFWNPVIGVLVFAFIAQSLPREQAMYILLGVVMWNIIWDAQYSLTVGALWEVWSRSLTTIFISPLTLEEFLTGQMVSSVIKAILGTGVAACIAFVAYQFSIFSLGWLFALYFVILLFFSWGIGMFVLSLIFRYGMTIQSLSWALVFLLQPFGGVFYPVSVLPESIRWLAYTMPSTYLFESMRHQLTTGVPNWQYIEIGAFLSLVYFIAGYFMLRLKFNQAKENGSLARLEG